MIIKKKVFMLLNGYPLVCFESFSRVMYDRHETKASNKSKSAHPTRHVHIKINSYNKKIKLTSRRNTFGLVLKPLFHACHTWLLKTIRSTQTGTHLGTWKPFFGNHISQSLKLIKFFLPIKSNCSTRHKTRSHARVKWTKWFSLKWIKWFLLKWIKWFLL